LAGNAPKPARDQTRRLFQPSALKEFRYANPVEAAEVGEFDDVYPTLARFALRNEGCVAAESPRDLLLGQLGVFARFPKDTQELLISLRVPRLPHSNPRRLELPQGRSRRRMSQIGKFPIQEIHLPGEIDHDERNWRRASSTSFGHSAKAAGSEAEETSQVEREMRAGTFGGGCMKIPPNRLVRRVLGAA
jgi:hypothetical protein